MNGISTVAKIERGVQVWHGHTERAVSDHVMWKGQWRFRSTDLWSTVTDRNQVHIRYATENAAIRAAIHVRNQALKFHS